MTDRSKGLTSHLLWALPVHDGSYFEDTLTYVCMHDSQGALGIVINKPLPLKLNQVIKQAELPDDKVPDSWVLEGGPVMQHRPSILHTNDISTDTSIELQDGLVLTMDTNRGEVYQLLNKIAEGKGPKKFRFALGYAGWGEGQLDSELERNIWLSCPSRPAVVFEELQERQMELVAELVGFDLRSISPGGEA